MYKTHPSQTLNDTFDAKPYQGANPMKACFLFVGLDANYAPELERTPIFPQILEYHADGINFWRKYGVHHPFLLPSYQGDGRFYHKSFSRIGFTSAHADQVSFIELLHKPTVGRNKLETSDLSKRHLKFIDNAIFNGNASHVFIPSGVARLLRTTSYGTWLPSSSVKDEEPLEIWHKKGSVTVYKHLHFSVYGKFENQKQREIESIKSLVMSLG